MVTHVTHCLSGVYVCYTAAQVSFKAPDQPGARPVRPNTGIWLRAIKSLFLLSPISSRILSLILLAVQGVYRSFLQHHISKASIFLLSAALIDYVSHRYVAIGKIKVETSLIFVLVVILLFIHIDYFNRLVTCMNKWVLFLLIDNHHLCLAYI